MSEKVAILVDNVSKSFKLPHERHAGLKQALINFRPGTKYEKQNVLTDISFQINDGEFFGIVGRNGSGKSTLLKLLAQIYTPNKGKVVINGSLTPFIELGVGFNPELTGRENVYLNGALLGFDRKQVALMYDDIVAFAELERFMDQKLKNYSSGMQVRLAFSIAIRAKTDILLIDEVLAVGDAAFQQKCFTYFEELRENKATVVLVTHDMEAVKRFCTRAVMIDAGKIKKIGSPLEIADLYIEENIAAGAEAENNSDEPGTPTNPSSTVSIEIAEKNAKEVIFQVNYASKVTDTYIGFSVIKDGFTFAELNNSRRSLEERQTGFQKYALQTTQLNSGTYEVGAALFKKHNKELIAITKKRVKFVISGHDESRGSVIKLPDNWV